MLQPAEQFMAWNKAQMEASVRLAGIALSGAEKLLEVQMEAAKAALADGTRNAKTLAEIKDPKELAQLKTTLLQPSFEKATAYFKEVYDVAAGTQAEINKLFEEQVTQLNKQIVTGLDQLVKSAPAGSEAAVGAAKSAMSAINAAYENVSKTAKQFAEVTQANVSAAANQFAQSSKKKAA